MVRFCVLDIDFLVQVDSFICDLLTNMPTNKDVLASPGKKSGELTEELGREWSFS